MLRLVVTKPLIFLACFAATVKAEGWDDFANNLATDLAPLLALFGEQVTKQFLSESITTLDNFIFAMAPLGIITAIVSAIRVYGTPSLRAFIGRANEGGGIAEAELCSSTSRDVCELYHNGAIVRVLGRPKILEIVHDYEGADFKRPDRQTPPTCGIYPFREYIKTARAKEAGWEEERVRRVRRGAEDTESQMDPSKKQPEISDSDDDDSNDGFAPNPNLSINIGIRKRSRHIMWLSATVGFLAQVSVLIVGFLVTYTWRWTKDDNLPPPWAFPLMSLGTVLLCGGMFSCAFLVERITKERVFRKSGGPATLHVVQPGNQIIGDQTFDSFSVAASLKEYTTSWKIPQHPSATRGGAAGGRRKLIPGRSFGRAETLGSELAQMVSRYGVWLATATTMAGFVLQFVGLRAMHSVVSVVQLGAILLMSIIRASLRTQRLPNERNRLRDCPDEVEGHELDWLALQLGKNERDQLGLQLGIEPGVENQERRLWSVIPRLSGYDSDSDIHFQFEDVAVRTYYYRVRLAELTSQSSVARSKSSTAWGEHLVHARQKAKQLKTAVESSSRVLLAHARVVHAWPHPWAVDVVELEHASESGSPRSLPSSQVLIGLAGPEASNGRKAWEVNQHDLEAVVGLWTWSVISDPRTEKVDKFGLRASAASEVPANRILAAGETAEDVERAKTEMAFWSDDFPSMSTMRWTVVPEHVERGPHTLLWRSREGDSDEICTHASSPGSPKHPNLRLYGWAVSHYTKPFVLTTKVNSQSVSATIAQELYQTFLCAITASVDSIGGETRPVKGRSGFYFANEVVSSLADCFEESGLGSRQDAYSVIIPALSFGSKLPLRTDALSVVHKVAEETWKQGDLREAEDMLKWAWKHVRSAGTMVELGELYRHALFSKVGFWKELGRDGIAWMMGESVSDDSAVGDICNRYDGLLRNLANPDSNRHPTSQDVIAAIARNDRAHSLWLISHAREVLTADATGRTVLSWAAQRGWLEVVKAALEIGSAVDSEDEAKRTPLSYAAEHGHTGVVGFLMERGALPIIDDSSGRTPLSYATAEGRVSVMETLLGDPRVSVHAKDNKGYSPLHWAAKGGHKDAIELLSQHKAEINDPDSEGYTPLVVALVNRQIPAADWLVVMGAKFEFHIQGSEAWRWAIKHGHWTCAAKLLKESNWQGTYIKRKRVVVVEVFPAHLRSSKRGVSSVVPKAAPGTEVVPYVLSEAGTREEITMETVRRAAGSSYYDVATWLCEGGDVCQLEEIEFDVQRRYMLVGLLLDHLGEDVKVTEDVVQAAAGNGLYGEQVLRLLLAQRGEQVKITEDVVKAAARNDKSGERVMSFLLAERGNEVKVTQDVVKAAAGNREGGEQVMRLLLDGQAEIVDLEKVAETIAREFGEPVMRRLLPEQDKEVKVTEDAARVVARNVSAN
jgi:ankyrin repeat protein